MTIPAITASTLGIAQNQHRFARAGLFLQSAEWYNQVGLIHQVAKVRNPGIQEVYTGVLTASPRLCCEQWGCVQENHCDSKSLPAPAMPVDSRILAPVFPAMSGTKASACHVYAKFRAKFIIVPDNAQQGINDGIPGHQILNSAVAGQEVFARGVSGREVQLGQATGQGTVHLFRIRRVFVGYASRLLHVLPECAYKKRPTMLPG